MPNFHFGTGLHTTTFFSLLLYLYKPTAAIAEHEVIAQWEAPLNFPRVTSLVKKTALGFRLSAKRRVSLSGTFDLRLRRKLRKRMHRRSRKFFIKDSREFAWDCCLSAVPEQLLKLQSSSDPTKRRTRKCMPSSSSVGTLKILIAGEFKDCCRVWSNFGPPCTGPEHPDVWASCHCVQTVSCQSVSNG